MMYNILMAVFFIGGLVLILLILLRKGEGMSLGGTFGGAGGDSAFGVKAQKQLDKIITYTAALFIISGILLNTPALRSKAKADSNTPQQQQEQQQGEQSIPEENSDTTPDEETPQEN